MYRLVLLDRDGVINRGRPERRPAHPDGYVLAPDAWLPIPRSLEAIAALNASGCSVAVCTNQSPIGRGMMSEGDLTAIHDHMRAALRTVHGHIDGIFFCPHRPDERCGCRKPKPGLLQAAMRDFGVPASATCFVGDMLSDMEAAIAAGCEPVLVLTGHDDATELEARALGVRHIYADLAAAAAVFLA